MTTVEPNQSPIILYVDDDEANRVIFELSFQDTFNIMTTESGVEALEILKTENIGVVLTDQRMPKMTGNELLTHVKAAHPKVIRVILTAYSQLDPILKAVNEGLVARYIIKPWNKSELEAVLEWGIEAFKLGQEDSALQDRLLQTERLVTLGSIAASVFHDLNQPIAYFSNNCLRLNQLTAACSKIEELMAKDTTLDSASRELMTDLVEELPEISNDMNAGCKVMHDLTHSMMRMISEDTVTEDGIDPYPIISYSMSLCKGNAIKTRGKINYEGPTQLPHVSITGTELTQILFNLINNAVQALEKSADRSVVTVSVTPEPSVIAFVIQDTGIGMSSETLDRVGKPFVSTKTGGTGLGLAQCRRLVGKAGGQLNIESTLGEGTRVSFNIPTATA
ncbi:MAG: hybrid sensor histidine kinase/response regulator [Deltaproteobacteria bacterium]|jgi:two-component system, NtrC family, sensor kinase|nr:hybrid sensor histidine kinase/response regulator [Deltaproteobacteria bacterium]MBT6434239.1 hybrid sensor histidine kinase/response regulator [Deltaproteobacteria bacterium]MBT6488485.1 hybrid sensor histidine kinase/response regulator [Deltaproteobacteria bacterium]